MDQLKKMISDKTAAVYFEMPGYLGVLEENAEEICTIAGNCGAVNIVGVDPISLGIVAPPMSYGADIVVGELQPLGIHMLCGGGQAGILAYRKTMKCMRLHASLECCYNRTDYRRRGRMQMHRNLRRKDFLRLQR